MPHEDVLDSAWGEGSIPECIGLKVMEGPGDCDLVGGYRAGACGRVNKLVGDDN